jgi:hypothetical protein
MTLIGLSYQHDKRSTFDYLLYVRRGQKLLRDRWQKLSTWLWQRVAEML